MKSIGKYMVYLRGSRTSIERTIWIDATGKAFVKYYGNMIEVTRGNWCYVTVGDY